MRTYPFETMVVAINTRWSTGLKLLAFALILALFCLCLGAPVWVYLDDRSLGSCPGPLKESNEAKEEDKNGRESSSFASASSSAPFSSSSSSSVSSLSSADGSGSSFDRSSDRARALLSFSRGDQQPAPGPIEAVDEESSNKLNGNFWHDFYSIWFRSNLKAEHAQAPGLFRCFQYGPGGLMLASWTGRHPLLPATACHWTDTVREWLQDRIETCGSELGDELGPAMVWGALTNHSDIVATALRAGTSVDYISSDRGPVPGFTALQVAAERGHDEIVQLLLHFGAATDLAVPLASLNKGGQTALMLATNGNHTKSFDLLLPKSLGSVNLQDGWGRTALMIAADGGFVHILSKLLDNSADVDRRNIVGGTALIAAARNACLQATELLLAAGANVDLQGYNRRTVLFWAAANGWLKVVKELIRLDMDPMEEDVNGIVPGDLVPAGAGDGTGNGDGGGDDLKTLRNLLPVPNYLGRWVSLLEHDTLKLALTVLLAPGAGVCIGFCVSFCKAFDCAARRRNDTAFREMPKAGAMILVSDHKLPFKARKMALLVRWYQAFSRVVAPMITMWVLKPIYVLTPFFLVFWGSLWRLPQWSPGELATQHHRSLLRANFEFSWAGQFLFVFIFGYFLLLLNFSCSCSAYLENPFYDALPLKQQRLVMQFVILLNCALFLQRLTSALLMLFRFLLQGLDPKFLNPLPTRHAEEISTEQQLKDLQRIWLWSRKVSETKNRQQLKQLGLQPLRKWGFSGLYTKVGLLVLDILTDLSSIHTFLLHRHFWFSGILLCTFTVSLFMEIVEGTIFNLPSEVRKSYKSGFVNRRLQELLDHEIGYEAVISLTVSVYGLPFAAVTPLERVMGIFSIFVSLYGLANFLHSKFDLRLSLREVGRLLDEREDLSEDWEKLLASNKATSEAICSFQMSRSSSWSSSTSWSSSDSDFHSESESDSLRSDRS